MRLALLILDENASIKNMAESYRMVDILMGRKYHNQKGFTIVANDDAIRGNELELSIRTDIKFSLNWETNYEYKCLLKLALNSGNIFVMKYDGWKYYPVAATTDDFYIVLLEEGRFNLKPRNYE